MTRAAYALLAQSRWILTGTPIVNNLKDLQSHVKFLHLMGGLEQPDIFSVTVIRPLNQGRSEASLLLQALITMLCLRLMKDMAFVDLRLPELSSHKYAVQFLPRERETYEAFAQEAKGVLIQYQTRKLAQGENAYSNLLEVLLRMRQTCNLFKLCGERVANLMAMLDQHQKVKLTPENLKSLRDVLQVSIDVQEDCAICLEPLHNPVVTACAHSFGGECIERVIEIQHKCPMCRAELQDSSDLVQPLAQGDDSEAETDVDIESSSSKTEAIMNILKASRKNTTTKTVIFSQWTSYLNIVAKKLDQSGFAYFRLDGTMKTAERDEALDSLAKDPDCTVMLASLGVCSVGLNLVAANQVILAGSWVSLSQTSLTVSRTVKLTGTSGHLLSKTKPSIEYIGSARPVLQLSFGLSWKILLRSVCLSSKRRSAS